MCSARPCQRPRIRRTGRSDWSHCRAPSGRHLENGCYSASCTQARGAARLTSRCLPHATVPASAEYASSTTSLLKAARCRWYPRRGISERRTRCPAVTSEREPRTLRARQAAPDAARRAARHARARRTHRICSKLSSDSESGIVPSSLFPSKYLRPACYARSTGRGRAGYSKSTSMRGGTANDTEYPTALRHCGAAASILTATCGEGTRTAVRRCVHAGVLTDTSGPALARMRTARHRARGARTEL